MGETDLNHIGWVCGRQGLVLSFARRPFTWRVGAQSHWIIFLNNLLVHTYCQEIKKKKAHWSFSWSIRIESWRPKTMVPKFCLDQEFIEGKENVRNTPWISKKQLLSPRLYILNQTWLKWNVNFIRIVFKVSIKTIEWCLFGDTISLSL